MATIEIPNKKPGDKLKATEVNMIVNSLKMACTMQKLTKEEYDLLPVVDSTCFYLCTGESGEVEYVYFGDMLFGTRSTGSEGFPYTFPFSF